MKTVTLAQTGRRAVGRVAEPDDATRPPDFSDDALAAAFTERHGDDLRYIAASSEWRRWDRTRWALEKTLLTFDYARSVCREKAADCNDARTKRAITSAGTVANVERMARADRKHAAERHEFDSDPWKFNTPDGVIDLKTGDVLPHRREDYHTKIAAVGPGGKCPRFRKFLDEVTDGDRELQQFIARMFGYGLTGVIHEHVLFFLWGLGGNGKGVLTEIIRRMMGDYAMPAPMEMFTATKFQGHTTDIASLQGARLVLASETEAGNFLAEARVKLLTGGDQVTARKMRSDNMSFSPQCKLVLSGNRRPHLRSSSEAMRRRLHLVPFDVTIPDERKDPLLLEKLSEELPGILIWALEGCIDWQRNRLQPPERVYRATTEYLAGQDTIGDWVSQHVERLPGSRCTSEQLFGSYRAYVASRGEDPGNLKDFVADMETQGFVKKRMGEGWRWQNVQLIDLSPEVSPSNQGDVP